MRIDAAISRPLPSLEYGVAASRNSGFSLLFEIKLSEFAKFFSRRRPAVKIFLTDPCALDGVRLLLGIVGADRSR